MTHAAPDDENAGIAKAPAATPSPAGQVTDIQAMFAPTTSALASIHKTQTHRDRWPVWPDDLAHLPAKLRRDAALQWAGRARNEYRSVHQFAALTAAATRARLPVEIMGGLARLVTDEVRHADICARMAVLCAPEVRESEPEIFKWDPPRTGWGEEPPDDAGRLGWMAYAVLEACCFGESLSVPMLKAISTVTTEPVAAATADQILRDEHLHARFGWETFGLLWPQMSPESQTALEARIPALMRGFERSCCQHITLADVAANPAVTIEPGDPADPNLGTLTALQYAVIFYATVETEILPGLSALGIDAHACWLRRLG